MHFFTLSNISVPLAYLLNDGFGSMALTYYHVFTHLVEDQFIFISHSVQTHTMEQNVRKNKSRLAQGEANGRHRERSEERRRGFTE